MADELNKQDLFILMESYKNNIQLNTTILEQQKQILILNDQFIEKQRDLCKSVDELIDRLSNCSKVLAENHTFLTNSIKDMSNSINYSLSTMSQDLKIEAANSHAKLSVDHSKLGTKIYVAMGGMIGIIVSLITLFAVFFHKIDYIAILLKNIIN